MTKKDTTIENNSDNVSEVLEEEETINPSKKSKVLMASMIVTALILIIVIIVVIVAHVQDSKEQKKASGKGKYEESKEYQEGEYYADVDIFDVARSQYDDTIAETGQEDKTTENMNSENETTEQSTTTAVTTETQTTETTQETVTTTQAPTTTEVGCEHSYEYVFIEGTGHFENTGEPIYVKTEQHYCYCCLDCGFYEDCIDHHYLNCPDCTSDNIVLEYQYIEEIPLDEPIYEQEWVIDVPDFEGYECTKCGHRKPL